MIRCGSCGASLEVMYDYPKLKRILSLKKLRSRPFRHARYNELFPVKDTLSLGEGGTPLLRSANIERDLSLNFELWFKCESQSPTGSFKDRGSVVEVSCAKQSGAKRVVVASTGNMGASVAAYSSIANLSCTVFVPRDARAVKIRQILSHGAEVLKVNGDYSFAVDKAVHLSRKGKHHLLGDYLYRREGTKSIGFEIADQLPATTHVFTPVGNGTLISAAWKAFREWRILGFSKSVPRMIGIQASGCSPITMALRKGQPIRSVRGRTIAVAIECGAPLDGPRAVQSITDSKGFSESTTDTEILKARTVLARREGIFAEPAGAASLAGLIKTKERIPKGARVVCVVSGHGLKAPHTPIDGKAVTS